jgi:predicted ATPase
VAFRRLAVFAGGFTHDAARAVSAGRLDALGRLVDKSLVVAEERDGVARFRMLETIRQYAAERLHEAGEITATRDRHLDHYLAVTEAAEPELERLPPGVRSATWQCPAGRCRGVTGGDHRSVVGGSG